MMYQLQTLRVRIEINIYLARKNVNVQLRSLQTVKNVHMLLNFKKKLKKKPSCKFKFKLQKKNYTNYRQAILRCTRLSL